MQPFFIAPDGAVATSDWFFRRCEAFCDLSHICGELPITATDSFIAISASFSGQQSIGRGQFTTWQLWAQADIAPSSIPDNVPGVMMSFHQ